MPIVSLSDDSDEYKVLTLEDGTAWTEAVLDGLENANWHDQLEAFSPLFKLLPRVYERLEAFGQHKLAKQLEESTNKWGVYF